MRRRNKNVSKAKLGKFNVNCTFQKCNVNIDISSLKSRNNWCMQVTIEVVQDVATVKIYDE